MKSEPEPQTAQWRPLFLNPRDSADRRTLAQLRADGQVRETFDTLPAQLRDLASVRHPQRKLTPGEMAEAVAGLLGDTALEEHGRWVFYPWTGWLVHLLEAGEFREVRLNRNAHKITPAEQKRLGEITVGVVGLSVGNAVARTLALEGCGRLKLADFDQLDLSNLNRLQAGVHEIGLNKAVLAARQILELDPDAQVEVFPHGLTEETLDEFLQTSPALDILVDECDGLEMKVLMRERARELRLPVLMETSDRGMLDVERFDLESDRPLFHGLVGNLHAADLHGLSTEQKVKHVLNIIGAETMSTRLAASMVEITHTVSTWPQLGSDVTLGGATVAAAVRRIALGQTLVSGRRYVDLGRMLDDAPAERALRVSTTKSSPAPAIAPGVSPFLQYLVEHAVQAPSGGNCQPWQFYADGPDQLHVVHDRERSANLLDRTHFASCISLGAAIENMVIAAAHRHRHVAMELFPAPDHPEWVATLRVASAEASAESLDAKLHDAIARRVTNRRQGDCGPLEMDAVQALIAAAAERGGHLQMRVEAAALEETARILGEGDRVRFLCPELHREVMSELRFGPAEVELTRDGIDLATLELSKSEMAAMRVLARPDVAAFLRQNNLGAALADGALKSIRGACAVGLIRARTADARGFVEVGRAIQRTWLTATQLGLGFQPMTALLFLFQLLDQEEARIFSETERRTLEALAGRVDNVFPECMNLPRAMLFRITRATEVTARSLRRPPSTVLRRGRPQNVRHE